MTTKPRLAVLTAMLLWIVLAPSLAFAQYVGEAPPPGGPAEVLGEQITRNPIEVTPSIDAGPPFWTLFGSILLLLGLGFLFFVLARRPKEEDDATVTA